MGPPASSTREENLQALERLCQHLGIPLAPNKREGPSSVLVFLGIEIDTVKGELRLPSDKLQRLTKALTTWLKKKSCSRKELESLIGTLKSHSRR